MTSKSTHFKGFSIIDADIKVQLDLSRFDKQFQRAQYELDGNVMNSMVPFMPMISGDFVDITRAESAAIQGIGKVYAAYGPAGPFLYQGKVMVSPVTGSTWAKKAKRKCWLASIAEKPKQKKIYSIPKQRTLRHRLNGLMQPKKQMVKSG